LFCLNGASREIYVELPDEGKTSLDGDVVGRLKRSLYGTRDAPLNWELTIRKIMMKLGFTQGKSNPCIYYHQKRDLRTVVHGDDFTTAGSYENIKWLHESLGKEWMVVEYLPMTFTIKDNQANVAEYTIRWILWV